MLQQAFVQNEIEKNKILEDLNGIHDFLKIGDKNYLEPTSFVFSSEKVALKRTITLIQLKTPHESIRTNRFARNVKERRSRISSPVKPSMTRHSTRRFEGNCRLSNWCLGRKSWKTLQEKHISKAKRVQQAFTWLRTRNGECVLRNKQAVKTTSVS